MITQIYSIVRLFLAFILISSLTACGGGSGSDATGIVSSSSETFSSVRVAREASQSSLAAIASEPTVSSSSAISPSLVANTALNTSAAIASKAAASTVSESTVTVSSVMVSSASVPSVVFSSETSAASAPVSSIPSSSSYSSSVLCISSFSSSSSSRISEMPELVGVSLTVPEEMYVGQTFPVSVQGVYSDGHRAPGNYVYWQSLDHNIVSVAGATISARAVGTTSVYAEIGDGSKFLSGVATITVKEFPKAVRAIHLEAVESGPLTMKDWHRLKVTVDCVDDESVVVANVAVKFVVDNPEIATVSISGFIDPVAPGKTLVTATFGGKSATYVIEVMPPAAVFHILKPASWKSTLNAHWFAPKVLGVTAEKLSTLPGSPMQDLDADGWYDISLPGVKDTNIVFNDGDAVNSGFHETTDQFNRNGGWFVPDEFPNAEGKFYGTWYDYKPVLAQQDVCDVKTFGAKGDGISKDTLAIQKAIDACAGKNGIVRLHDGKFVAGTIVLKSDMTLRIEPTATLLGVRDAADYPDQPKLSGNSQYLNCRKALIYAEKAKNIRIDGGGTIDGNGGNGSPWMTGPEATRPMAIFLVQSDGITLQNITVKNSAMWTVVPFESTNITIRGVTVNSLTGHNLDGIDLVDSRYVLVEAVDVTSQDDAICLKSGSAALGVNNVLVRYSKVNKSTLADGLKLGTASSGRFYNIAFDNIALSNVARAGIAVESVDGSHVRDISYRNITMDKVGTPFYIVLDYRSEDANLEPSVGSIRDLTFENIIATNTTKTWGSYMSGVTIKGETYRLYNLLFKDVNVNFPGGSTNVATPWEFNESFAGKHPDPGSSTNTSNKKDMPAYFYLRHADGVKLINLQVPVTPADSRLQLHAEDVLNLTGENY